MLAFLQVPSEMSVSISQQSCVFPFAWNNRAKVHCDVCVVQVRKARAKTPESQDRTGKRSDGPLKTEEEESLRKRPKQLPRHVRKQQLAELACAPDSFLGSGSDEERKGDYFSTPIKGTPIDPKYFSLLKKTEGDLNVEVRRLLSLLACNGGGQHQRMMCAFL